MHRQAQKKPLRYHRTSCCGHIILFFIKKNRHFAGDIAIWSLIEPILGFYIDKFIWNVPALSLFSMPDDQKLNIHCREVSLRITKKGMSIYAARCLLANIRVRPMIQFTKRATTYDKWRLLLTWLNLNPSMLLSLYLSYNVGWNDLSIPKLQRLNRWSLEMDK